MKDAELWVKARKLKREARAEIKRQCRQSARTAGYAAELSNGGNANETRKRDTELGKRD